MEDKKVNHEISDDDLNAVAGGWDYIIDTNKWTTYCVGEHVGLIQRVCKGCKASIITGMITGIDENRMLKVETECCGTEYLVSENDIHCKF